MKYFLSLCCIIKNERNLEEFIMYYRILGVEHFYIYDNESDIPISKRLSHSYFKKICTVIPFPGKIQQLNAYNNCLKHHGHETNWLIVVDGDEFICPKNPKHFSLRDFLKEFKGYHAIGINWVMFGSSFHDKKQEGFIIDKYRFCENHQNKHIKTICKPKYTINFPNPHYAIIQDPSKYVDCHKRKISGPFNEKHTIDCIQINHYWGKSKEEHYEKRDRGRATTIDLRVIDDDPHEKYNEKIDNFLPNKYLDHVIQSFYMMTINWKIYRALNKDLQKNFSEPYQYYDHLFEYGITENRMYKINDKYPNFNNDIYRKNYKDLEKLSDIDLEVHYINLGCRENRICDYLL